VTLVPSMLPVLATTITVGDHIQRKIFGLTVNVDTLWATAAAALIVVIFAAILRYKSTSGVPGKFPLAWETAIELTTRQVEGSIGPRGRAVIPLALTLFVFILICNTFEIFGLGAHFDWLTVPTADINVTLALAIIVIIPVHVASVRSRGIRGYLRHYAMQPFPVFLMPANVFINVVEEVAKPLTLALRLFGNMLSAALMLTLIAYLGVWKIGAVPIGNVLVIPTNFIWKLFDVFLIGPIQAFIFALLTILYFDTAMATDGHGHDSEELLADVRTQGVPPGTGSQPPQGVGTLTGTGARQ